MPQMLPCSMVMIFFVANMMIILMGIGIFWFCILDWSSKENVENKMVFNKPVEFIYDK